MNFTTEEILQTIRMVELENLDIRTVTLGISLVDCTTDDVKSARRKVREKILRVGTNLVPYAEGVAEKYGIPIVNKRIAVSPIGTTFAFATQEEFVELAQELDDIAQELGIDFIGGYSALVEKGCSRAEERFLASIPEALATTRRLCSSVNVASTHAGINMDAILRMGQLIKEAAYLSRDASSIACAKFVVFANAVPDNPFMAGAFHGFGEPEFVLNVGVSGPGVVKSAIAKLNGASLGEVADEIKRIAFKITRAGELVGREVARLLDVPFGILDLSLAPTPAALDSVAEIIEEMGIERVGAHGTTAALALLVAAVKKGGSFASSYVGGLSGAFIPLSEDANMIRAAREGALSLDKLEAMTAVCSVGLDMIAIPGDTPAETVSAIIADEIAIGVVNNKTTGVRIIPAHGMQAGDEVNFGGLLGTSPVLGVNRFGSAGFVRRGGRIPATGQSLKN